MLFVPVGYANYSQSAFRATLACLQRHMFLLYVRLLRQLITLEINIRRGRRATWRWIEKRFRSERFPYRNLCVCIDRTGVRISRMQNLIQGTINVETRIYSFTVHDPVYAFITNQQCSRRPYLQILFA